MADANSVSSALATLGGSGWNTFEPAPGARLPVEVLGMQHTQRTKDDLDALESDSMFTLNILANRLGPNSALRILTLWTVTNGASTKLVRGRFGGTVLWQLDLTTVNALQFEFILRNRNSRSAQVGNPQNVASFSTYGSNNPQTFSIDFATAQQLTITGQHPVAGVGSNIITLDSVMVEHLYGA